MREQDKNKNNHFWRRDLRSLISRTRNLKELIELSGVDPESDYAKTLLALHATENEELLEKLKQPLLHQASERMIQNRVFPIIRESKQEGIFIGTSTDLVEDGAKIYIPIKNFSQHCGIFGTTGSGKSHLLKFILAQLINQGVVAWIFDLEDEFSCLLPLFDNGQLLYALPAWVKINPFEARGDPLAWIGKIVSLIRSTFYLRDGSAALLSKILSELYQKRGCFNGSSNWPSLSDVWRYIQTLKFAKTARSSGYLESLLRCIGNLMDRLGPTLNNSHGLVMNKLVQRSIIFNVSSLDPQELEFFIVLLLEASGKIRNNPTQRIIILEESHVLLNLIRQKREDLGEPPLQQAFRRLRKRNSNFIIVDQSPGLLPESVIANLRTRIVFALINKRCQNVMRVAMGLEEEKARSMPSFPMKTFALQNQELGKTILVRAPEVNFPSPPGEKTIEQEMKTILNSFLPKLRVQKELLVLEEKPNSRGTVTHKSHKALSKEHHAPGEKHHTAEKIPGEAVKDIIMRPTSQGPSLVALRYLEQWNQPKNQYLTLTKFDMKQRVKTTKGNSLREELENAGMIEIVNIKTGKKGQHKTVKIIKKGFTALKEMGIKPNPLMGKGKFQSQFWAVQICRNLTRTVPGSNPKIEDVRMGKAVDVSSREDGKLKAYEISMTPNWTTQNVVKDILAGYDEVVICAIKPEDLKAIKKKLQKDLEQGQVEDREIIMSKVSFRLLRTFL